MSYDIEKATGGYTIMVKGFKMKLYKGCEAEYERSEERRVGKECL